MEATLNKGENSMKLHTPDIIMMSEGEARLRTVTERLWSHSNRKVATNLDILTDQMAENFWTASCEETANEHVNCCEELLSNYGVAPASAIGHLIGWNQY